MRVMEKQLCNPDRPCKFHREATGLAIAPINLRVCDDVNPSGLP